MKGRLHFSQGSFSLVPAALEAIEKAAFHPWEKTVAELLRQWWSTEDQIVLTTSGSTGSPESICHSKEAVRKSARRTIAYFTLKEGSHAALAMPVRFVGGMMMVVRAIEGNWNLHVVEPILAPKFPSIPFDFVALTPAQVQSILLAQGDLRSMEHWKILLMGGSSFPALIVSHFPEKIRVYESFGMTETVSHVAVRSWLPLKSDAFECLPGIKVSLQQEDALCIHMPETEPLSTSDSAKLIDERHFVWLGRLDDAINSGGVKVYPQAVEEVLSEWIDLPFIVYGRPHPILGQEVVLRIHADDEPSHADEQRQLILNAGSKRLSQHHAPRVIEWRPIEKTPSGKWKRPH
jgi:O-succinylbenzoic acid--CoA ligase